MLFFKFQSCYFYCIVFLFILASEKLSLMHIHLLSWHYFVPILFLFISYSLDRALLKSILLKTLLWFSLLIHTYPFVTTFIILADVVELFSNAPRHFTHAYLHTKTITFGWPPCFKFRLGPEGFSLQWSLLLDSALQ